MPSTNFRNSTDFRSKDFYVGIDVHKKSWSVTVRAFNLEVEHFTQPPVPEILTSHLYKKFPNATFHSAYEAGFCGTSAHQQLCHLGFDNVIAHAADIPSTDKQKKSKTDLHDSRSIAKCLEIGTIHGIHVLSNEQQELRSLYRYRELKIRDRTRANNRLKSFLMFMGINLLPELISPNGLSNKAIKWIEEISLTTKAGTLCLSQYIEDLRQQKQKVIEVTLALKELAERTFPTEYKLLLSLPGFGPIISIALLAEIGDFRRFKDPSQYNNYLGFIPWENSSGESIKTKGIQPRCNTHLRPMLIEAAWLSLRKDANLLCYYKKHYARGNKHAIVKVARKLALIARGVILNKKPYDPDYAKK
jgi:transposase